jgi:FAD/FMN-containing dehydrogenase
VPAALAERLLSVARREAPEISARFPKVLRRVGGYNLDQLLEPEPNLARLLVGSEGTLAFFTELELLLQPLPRHRVLGVCHFPTFAAAMESTEALVALGPVAVELVDRTILELSRAMPEFAPILARFVRGEPDALLLVEFSGDDPAALREKLADLDRTMERLGFTGGNVSVVDAGDQAKLWTVRSAGLNIVSSTRGDSKPVSVIEDCAVPLKHLAPYTARLTRLFEKHGTRGAWYAASVGCLHVRLRTWKAPRRAEARAIAERPSPSSASMAEATPGNTATGWCGASSTPRWPARGWCAPSRR